VGGGEDAAGAGGGAIGRGVAVPGDAAAGAGVARGVAIGGAAAFRADFVLVGADGASSRMIAATAVKPTTIAATPQRITSRAERPRLGAGRG